jgi:hypothetical protein
MIISSFYNKERNRRAEVIKADNGYHVRLFIDNVLEDVRDVSAHSISYAEDCAENFVEGIFDVDNRVNIG